MTKNERAAMELAAKLDVDMQVTVSRDFFDVDMWSPKGFSFADSGCHASVVNIDARHEDVMPKPSEMWGYVLARLQEGLEPCAPDCDACRDMDETTEEAK